MGCADPPTRPWPLPPPRGRATWQRGRDGTGDGGAGWAGRRGGGWVGVAGGVAGRPAERRPTPTIQALMMFHLTFFREKKARK